MYVHVWCQRCTCSEHHQLTVKSKLLKKDTLLPCYMPIEKVKFHYITYLSAATGTHSICSI